MQLSCRASGRQSRMTHCAVRLLCWQVGETEPFICELLTNLTGIIQDLETHQIHMFYETVGLMISAETVPEKRDEYVVRVCEALRPCRPTPHAGIHAGTVHVLPRRLCAACCAMLK